MFSSAPSFTLSLWPSPCGCHTSVFFFFWPHFYLVHWLSLTPHSFSPSYQCIHQYDPLLHAPPDRGQLGQRVLVPPLCCAAFYSVHLVHSCGWNSGAQWYARYVCFFSFLCTSTLNPSPLQIHHRTHPRQCTLPPSGPSPQDPSQMMCRSSLALAIPLPLFSAVWLSPPLDTSLQVATTNMCHLFAVRLPHVCSISGMFILFYHLLPYALLTSIPSPP